MNEQEAVLAGVASASALSVLALAVAAFVTGRRLARLRARAAQARRERLSGMLNDLARMRADSHVRMARLAGVLGDPGLLTSLLDDDNDSVRVLFSPEAEEQVARLSVSVEHVEAVLADPAGRSSHPSEFAVELSRDFGNRTLRVLVSEPWPAFATVYIKGVQWASSARKTSIWRRLLRLGRTANHA